MRTFQSGFFCDRHPFEHLVREKLCLGPREVSPGLTEFWSVLSDEVKNSAFETSLSPARCLTSTLESVFGKCKALCLVTDLREMVEKYSGLGARIRLEIEDGVGIGVSDKALIFFVDYIHEAIGNSLKHGRASEIDIVVEATRGWLELVVSDNGRWKEPEDKNGMGLAMSRKFVAREGGELQIGPNPDGGVIVKMKLPRSDSYAEILSDEEDKQLEISLVKLPGYRVVAETCDKRWFQAKIRERFLSEVMAMTKYQEPLWKHSSLVGGMIVLARDRSNGDFDDHCRRLYLKANSPFGRELQGRLGSRLHNQYGQVLSGAILSLQLLIDQLPLEKSELRAEGEDYINRLQKEAESARALSHRLYDFLNGKGKLSPLLE